MIKLNVTDEMVHVEMAETREEIVRAVLDVVERDLNEALMPLYPVSQMGRMLIVENDGPPSSFQVNPRRDEDLCVEVTK